MAIAPNQTFTYEFAVLRPDFKFRSVPAPPKFTPPDCALAPLSFTGQGSGSDGMMLGPNPLFELRGGWLILRRSDLWSGDPASYSLFIGEALANVLQSAKAAFRGGKQPRNSRSVSSAVGAVLREFLQSAKAAFRGGKQPRNSRSVSSADGAVLRDFVRSGDALNFSRDGNGDFHYSVQREGETIFSAGSIRYGDKGGPFAVWQSGDAYPNHDPPASQPSSVDEILNRMRQRQELEDTHKVYATARINRKLFHLLDGDGASEDGYFVYLARRNPVFEGFEFTPRAVHAAGRLDAPGRELIVDAAQQLLFPKTMQL